MMLSAQVICFIVVLPVALSNGMSKEFESIFESTKPTVSADVQGIAAQQVINRTVPLHAHLFEVTIVSDLPLHTFQLIKANGDDIVQIRATSGVIACKGFYHYLKFYCNSHVSWDGYRIDIPDELPDVNVTETSMSRFIYYQNVCTWSYSFAWWQWKDWVKHIDWMAMQGISLVLAPTQEKVWTNVYGELGMTKDEIDDHLAGPAFFAWQRMGNIRGFGGPLSKNFKLWSSALQKQMISSLQNLGIAVALPAFSGHIPQAFKRIFPNATYTSMPIWDRFPTEFCCPLFIDPVDPLFKKVGKLFLTKVIEEYGNGNHIYFADPFNEMNPSNQTVEYISKVSNTIYMTMKEVDPNAIWLLQGWFFLNPMWNSNLVKAFLTSVPIGRILVLDLHADIHPLWQTTMSFYGQPFIWCMLHNFGGTLGMQGNFNIINQEIVKARKFHNSSMIGVGITPEGINQNYVMYDFALDRAWYQDSTNVSKWLDEYTFNRYGLKNDNIQNAWSILKDTVYSYDGPSHHGKYIVCRRPSIIYTPWTWYNLTLIDDVLDELLKTPEDLIIDNELFKHDLVDITRQFLQNKIELLYSEIKTAFRSKDLKALERVQYIFESILLDLDKILQTNEHFLLGKWIASAKSLATNELEEILYEYNARNQITIWGPNGQIVDYAHKQWAGIVRDYCLPRWQVLFFELGESIKKNNGKFSDSKTRQKIFRQIEEPFTVSRKEYNTDVDGDTIQVSRKILQKWHVDIIALIEN